jgi:uncharacterized protein with WD repeat
MTGQDDLTLKGHSGSVFGVSFSPDGARLASASWDQTVKIWDVMTGQETLTLTGHAGAVNGVAYSPDGARLASASADRTVKIWDVRTGQDTLTLKGHTGVVSNVVYSPDGTRLASASRDGTVKIWDVTIGQVSLTLKGYVGDMAFSFDGTRLASASTDRTVKIWDVRTGQEVLTLKGHTDSVLGVSFSPDGTRLASASRDGTVKIWDARTGQECLTLKGHTREVLKIAFSSDGTRLASASSDQNVKVWDCNLISPGSLARDDAIRVIRILLDHVASESELRNRIAIDKRIPEQTRATALKLARGFWATRIRGQAQSLVSSLFARPLLRADVLDAVRAEPGLDVEVRAVALALAETWPESASALNNESFKMIGLPNRPESDFQRGLRLAEAAIRIEPDNGAYLKTLGVAQYRMGRYQEAQATLERSNQLTGNHDPVADLAFLAMAQHRLNQMEAARATLKQLREVMKDPRIGINSENQGFLREAESVILGSANLPEGVFAP